MTEFAKVGAFQNRSTTGSQSVSGLGFQPKGLFVWSANTTLTPPEFADFAYWSVGFTDGTSHFAISALPNDNIATSDGGRNGITTGPFYATDTGSGTQHAASFTSFDADGFTVNWTTVTSSQQKYWNYLALGGSSINCKAGSVNLNTSTGNQAITGVGFQPTGVIILPVYPSAEGTDACTFPALGWTDGTRQGCAFVVSQDNQAVANTFRYQRTNKLAAFPSLTGTVAAEITIVSLDSDGFTINVGTASAGVQRVWYFCFNGTSVYAGSFNQPTSNGLQAVNGVGFQPGSILFQSYQTTSQTTVQDHEKCSFGGACGTVNLAASLHDTDAADPMVGARYYTQTKCIAAMTANATGSSSTLDAAANLETFDGDGFTVNWTTTDATAREVLFLAIRASDPGGGSVGQPTMKRWGGSILPTGARRIGKGW